MGLFWNSCIEIQTMNVCLETNLYFVTPRTHETSSGIKSRQEEDFIVLSDISRYKCSLVQPSTSLWTGAWWSTLYFKNSTIINSSWQSRITIAKFSNSCLLVKPTNSGFLCWKREVIKGSEEDYKDRKIPVFLGLRGSVTRNKFCWFSTSPDYSIHI